VVIPCPKTGQNASRHKHSQEEFEQKPAKTAKEEIVLPAAQMRWSRILINIMRERRIRRYSAYGANFALISHNGLLSLPLTKNF
jgi:hypothetical protein